MLHLERETEEVAPHTVPHNCILFFAAATNAQKNQIITTPGVRIPGQSLFQRVQGRVPQGWFGEGWCEGSSWHAAFRLRCTVCCDVVKHEPATAQQTELNRETPSVSSCGSAARRAPRSRTFFFPPGRENVHLIANPSKNLLPDPPRCHFARYKYN